MSCTASGAVGLGVFGLVVCPCAAREMRVVGSRGVLLESIKMV